MFGNCQRYLWHLSAISVAFVSDICGICQRYLWHLSAISVAFASDVRGICQRCPWHLPDNGITDLKEQANAPWVC